MCAVNESKNMKMIETLSVAALAITLVATPLVGWSADSKTEKVARPKPYPLTTCVVSDEKFGGDMGEPYVFTFAGREVKLCCKSCKKDFDKNTKKFVKKMEDAEKQPKK